jgi:hypothetical protein
LGSLIGGGSWTLRRGLALVSGMVHGRSGRRFSCSAQSVLDISAPKGTVAGMKVLGVAFVSVLLFGSACGSDRSPSEALPVPSSLAVSEALGAAEGVQHQSVTESFTSGASAGISPVQGSDGDAVLGEPEGSASAADPSLPPPERWEVLLGSGCVWSVYETAMLPPRSEPLLFSLMVKLSYARPGWLILIGGPRAADTSQVPVWAAWYGVDLAAGYPPMHVVDRLVPVNAVAEAASGWSPETGSELARAVDWVRNDPRVDLLLSCVEARKSVPAPEGFDAQTVPDWVSAALLTSGQ